MSSLPLDGIVTGLGLLDFDIGQPVEDVPYRSRFVFVCGFVHGLAQLFHVGTGPARSLSCCLIGHA